MIATLDQLKNGQYASVHQINGGHRFRQRLSHLGVHPGDTVWLIRSGFFGGPVLIRIHGVELAIGQGMARKIEVEVAES
jgi:ferrous iron transport protein A